MGDKRQRRISVDQVVQKALKYIRTFSKRRRYCIGREPLLPWNLSELFERLHKQNITPRDTS
jgi:hypothetical protein